MNESVNKVITRQERLTEFIEERQRLMEMVKIIQDYFEDRNCVTFLEVATNFTLPNTFYTVNTKVMTAAKVKEQDISPKFGMTYPPRRDLLRSYQLAKCFCDGTLNGFIITSLNIHVMHYYILSNKLLTPFLDPQASILIYLSEMGCKEIDIKLFFSKLWSIYKTPNVIVFANCSYTWEIYFYNAMIKIPTGEWGNLSRHSLEDIKNNIEIVKNDMKDFNKYPFRNIMFNSVMAYVTFQNDSLADFEGIDGNLLSTLETYMNFEKRILPDTYLNYGFRKPDGSFTGALKYLAEGATDFIAVTYFLSDYFTRDIEFTATATQDDLCIVVPRSGLKPLWEVFLTYYDVWLILFASYFIIAFTWTVLQTFEVSVEGYKKIHDAILPDTFRLMIATSFTRVANLHSERVFLVFCMMAFITFLGAFQGSLMSIFSTPVHYPEIKTLEMLSQNNFPIYTRSEGLKNEIFSDESNPVNVKLKSMVTINTKKQKSETIVALYGDSGALMRRGALEVENGTRYYDKTGAPVLYLVDECIRTYALAYVLPKNSAFAPRINELILRASQAGLFLKWYRGMAFNVTQWSKKSRLEQMEKNGSTLRKFTLEDLQIGFYEIIFGYIISSLVFIIELLCKCRYCCHCDCCRKKIKKNLNKTC